MKWNEFVAKNSSPASFLQSFEWGQFQEALGNKVYRLSFPEGEGEIELTAQVIVKKLPLGRSYLEIPKGPIVSLNLESGILNLVTSRLREIGKKEKAVLARVNPPYSNFQFPIFNFQRPEILIYQREPQETILVDLSKSEDELLANMHEKSRYNIRLAQRKGVTIRDGTTDQKAFEKFLDLLEETTRRDKIVSWPKERFWKFREMFMTQNNAPQPPLRVRGGEGELLPHAILLVGELAGQILAASIIMLFGDAGTYLYAASSGEERTANAPSLVLWEAIRVAKRAGKRWYDMWGIAPDNDPNHPWAGITRFKSRYVKIGMTGQEVHSTGTWDLVLDKTFYNLFRLGKKLLSW